MLAVFASTLHSSVLFRHFFEPFDSAFCFAISSTAVVALVFATTPVLTYDCIGVDTERLVLVDMVNTRGGDRRLVDRAFCKFLVNLRKHFLKLNDVVRVFLGGGTGTGDV